MSNTAIHVENLSKFYRIGAGRERHDTLRGALVAAFRRPNGDGSARSNDTEFWALKDVSFEVKRGEVVGVIGGNGAGKSTLLKILSRITEPTSGRAEIHGRVGSLLEVGTGFHPELTGRENIYLNGAILGMRRTEIDARFDEIVAFAEIDRFLDTPVKRYSSGMYVRLAFAVAAHLEPEILLVDEVLAVGDVAFQKKCLGKMGDVAGEGRTVLFVSHNMAAVENLTHTCLVLADGHALVFAETPDAIAAYTGQYRSSAYGVLNVEQATVVGGDRTRILDCRLNSSSYATGAPFALTIVVERDAALPEILAELSVTFSTSQGAHVLQAYSAHMGQSFLFGGGPTTVNMEIDSLPLVADDYWIDLWLGTGDTPVHWLRECMMVSVQPGSIYGDRTVDPRTFPVVVPSNWTGARKVQI